MIEENDINESDDSEEWVSKTQRKREMQYRQDLGERILALKQNHRDQLNLSEELIRALEETKRIKKNEALRRHKQYIGKLMRDIDLEHVEAFLEKLDNSHEINTRAFHDLEDLRERLIEGDNSVVGEAIGKYPNIDKQKLRQLVRNAKKERQTNISQNASETKQSRALFRFLRDSGTSN
ncbi:MAG: DUF615 domain-containing protein [Pseudomonadales bacterium]|nr:DUF615 domain-containing protein [Pseudomonadales bacterium]